MQPSSRKPRRAGASATASAPARTLPRSEPAAPALSRSERKDAEARARLTPLAPGERPRPVTVAAVAMALLCVANLAAFAAGAKIGGHRADPAQVGVFSLVALVLAGGMWRTRYWAVALMQALLVVTVVVFALLLMVARNLQAAAECVVAIGLAGTLFWFLIRAMGRIQAPPTSDGEPPDRLLGP